MERFTQNKFIKKLHDKQHATIDNFEAIRQGNSLIITENNTLVFFYSEYYKEVA